MITKLSHITIYVSDQNKAYEVYVNKLGCKVNTDRVHINLGAITELEALATSWLVANASSSENAPPT